MVGRKEKRHHYVRGMEEEKQKRWEVCYMLSFDSLIPFFETLTLPFIKFDLI